MYEVKARKKSVLRCGNTKRNNMPTQMPRHRHSFASRNIKLGYCPVKETGSVLQMQRCLNCGKTLNQCDCGAYKPDDSGDLTYCENTHKQYLSAPKLRGALGAIGSSGEAHHIFPGNVVEKKNLDQNGKFKEEFNKSWNGIMLNGTTVGDSENGYHIVNEYTGNAPDIMHRNRGMANHDRYDQKICNFINTHGICTCEDCKNHVSKIRESIKSSKADCLDNI